MGSETSAPRLLLRLSYGTVFTVASASSVVSLACALGPASLPLCLRVVVRDRWLDNLGHAEVFKPWTGDLLLAVRLQSAGCVSASPLLPRGAENGVGLGWPLVLALATDR